MACRYAAGAAGGLQQPRGTGGRKGVRSGGGKTGRFGIPGRALFCAPERERRETGGAETGGGEGMNKYGLYALIYGQKKYT